MMPADLFSVHARGVMDRQRLQAYINTKFNRQYHNGMFRLLLAFSCHSIPSTRAGVLDRTGTLYPAVRVSIGSECKSNGWRRVGRVQFFAL
jgi:hypothetical protein